MKPLLEVPEQLECQQCAGVLIANALSPVDEREAALSDLGGTSA